MQTPYAELEWRLYPARYANFREALKARKRLQKHLGWQQVKIRRIGEDYRLHYRKQALVLWIKFAKVFAFVLVLAGSLSFPFVLDSYYPKEQSLKMAQQPISNLQLTAVASHQNVPQTAELEQQSKIFNQVKEKETLLGYRRVDSQGLSKWLKKRNSLLAQPEQLEIIIAAGKEFNVDPLLLIAIAGQEQGFVPADIPGSQMMLKNPFNVYGSWLDYSPGLEPSARIAANTVKILSQDQPVGADPIGWLSDQNNPRGFYAEDRNWWRGVRSIYKELEQFALMQP